MFGNFGFFNYEESTQNAEIINQKLEDISKPPSLEDLLILEGITDEFQNKNKKLINFFTKEKIKQMLDYIIKEPKEDDYNKGHKFPFVCSKLFNIEEKKIMNYFHMTNKELLEEENKNTNLSQKNNENNYNQNMNIDDDDDDDIGKFYKVTPHDNFEDDNFDEVNMDDINNNEENKDEDDHVNYKDDVNNNEEKYNELNIYENQKDDEDDIVNVNHADEDLISDNIKEEKKGPNSAENKIELINEKNNDKIEDDKINIDNNKNELLNIQNNNDIEIKNESDENKDNKINENNKDNINIKDKNDITNEDKNKMEEIKEDYPEERIEILDYFLSFLLTDAELNYVLCGYFSSLMSILLNNYYNKIIKYLFSQRKDILKKLVYHCYRKSIAEILYKIINFEDKFHENNINNDDDDIDLNEFSDLRLEIIKNIFDVIDINKDTEKISSLSFLIQDLTKNKIIFENIINSNYIINALIKKQLGEFNMSNLNNDMNNIFNKKNNFIIICDIIILWLNTIKELEMQIPMLLYEVNEDSDEDTVQQKALPNPELHHTILSQALFDILPDLIKNNFNENKNEKNTILQSFNDEKIIPLGLFRIKLVELISNLIIYFRNIPNEFDELIIKTEFIPNLINYIFKYENNNLYQEAVLNFFNILFKKEEDCPYHEKLYDYIFSNLNFFEKIKTNFPKCEKSEGNSGLGYTSFFVSLCYKINTVIGGVPLNLGKSYTKEGNITFINRTKNPRLNGINLPFNIKEKTDKENEEIKNNNIIPCLKKYCNEEWKYFFDEKIGGKVTLYEDNFCDIKNSYNNISEKDDDLFYNPMNDIDNDNNGEKENLLGFGNKRYFNKDNLNKFSFDDNNNDNNKNLSNYKDMEININDFNFNENEKDEDIKDIKDENDINEEEENDEFNSVNYWKNNLEKEKNSYVNIIGEDAMNELLEE